MVEEIQCTHLKLIQKWTKHYCFVQNPILHAWSCKIKCVKIIQKQKRHWPTADAKSISVFFSLSVFFCGERKRKFMRCCQCTMKPLLALHNSQVRTPSSSLREEEGERFFCLLHLFNAHSRWYPLKKTPKPIKWKTVSHKKTHPSITCFLLFFHGE